MKKFELTTETKINICGKKLFRIKALISFGLIIAGEKGGWIEKEENLSQYGNAWVFGNAEVYDNACVRDNAYLSNSIGTKRLESRINTGFWSGYLSNSIGTKDTF